MKGKNHKSKYLEPGKAIKEALLRAVNDLKLKADSIHLEHPANERHGDYSTNIAMAIFGNSQFKTPHEAAKAMVEKLKKNKELFTIIEKVEVAGPGFINFWLKKEWLIKQLSVITTRADEYGKSKALKNKRIMVEFAHPNTHKQFHIGHLRNIIIGESLSRLLEANGAEVIRTNYQGDVGLHVAKAIWGVRQEMKNKKLSLKDLKEWSLDQRIEFLGKAYSAGSLAYDKNEEAKKTIIKINKVIYQKSDKDIIRLWKVTRQWSLDYFDEIYQRLNTKFDRLYFESEVHRLGKKIVIDALKLGILTKDKGAIVFKGKKYGLDTRVFLTKEGLPTYEAKELGLAELEFSEFGEIDLCIHVVAPEQTSFFKVTFKVEELLDPEKYGNKQYHLKYGFVDLKSGKMSSRKGLVVTGPSVIDAAREKAEQIMRESEITVVEKDSEEFKQLAEQVALAAVKYTMLKYSLEKNISFDIEESVSLEGDSGPYLQYTHARCKSVLVKSEVKSQDLKIKDCLLTLNIKETEEALLRWIYRFPTVVKEAGLSYAPNLICSFLFELAQRYNTFYHQHPILKAESEEQREFRLLITASVAQVLKNGLSLLGIEAPQRM